MLTHFQICEALDKVLGKHYLTPLMEFEKKKSIELFEYNKTSNPSCIKIMNEKLAAYLRWVVLNEHGCIPVVFGEDIKVDMPEEEYNFIS